MTNDQVIAFAHESDECLNKKGGGVHAFSFDELKRAFEAVAAQAAPAELRIYDNTTQPEPTSNEGVAKEGAT